MDYSFSFFNYWKSPSSTVKHDFNSNSVNSTPVTTIHHLSDSDDGSFFDFEFTADDDDQIITSEENDEFICVQDINSSEESENGENVDISPSDHLRGPPTCTSSSLLKSAGVLNFKLKKSSKSNAKSDEQVTDKDDVNKSKSYGKLLTVKFKLEEVPILSLFTRDYSSKVSNTNNKSMEEERGFSKHVLQRYIKKVKPLYFRVSKLGFSGQMRLGVSMKNVQSSPQPISPRDSPEVSETVRRRNVKRGSLAGGLRKHLGKVRSTAVAASPTREVVSKRRDDSLLQQEDGIQSAIMYCKRSFVASRI